MDRLTSPETLAWLLAALVVVLVGVVATLLVLRVRDRKAAEREAIRQHEDLRAQGRRLAEVERRMREQAVTRRHDDPEHVITRLGEPEEGKLEQDRAPTTIDGRLFTDIVARESVVKAASWTHALRTALSAESRNRIRFAMRQETKLARKERKAEVRQALREHRARAAESRAADGREGVA